MNRPRIFHIPVCPFSQRVEILLELKGSRGDVDFHVVDITRPRPDWLVEKTGGSTAMPILETPQGGIIKESLVILRYIEDLFPDPPVARKTPWERAVENMLIAMEGAFVTDGYRMVMNQDRAARADFVRRMNGHYAAMDAFLRRHNPDGTWLFDHFGLAETVYTPMFMRFWFLEYYEDYDIPAGAGFDRVRRWRDACRDHPAAQQVSRDEIIKLYYDYALGHGNGALPPGRKVSSFAFDPPWQSRPLPPRHKFGRAADDAALGLLPGAAPVDR